MNNSVYHAIYQIVAQIPQGKVITYGGIARLLANCTPRMVGYAMATVPKALNIPWHRVVNSQGRISVRANGLPDERQYRLLESEGIEFSKSGKIDLQKYGWNCGH